MGPSSCSIGLAVLLSFLFRVAIAPTVIHAADHLRDFKEGIWVRYTLIFQL